MLRVIFGLVRLYFGLGILFGLVLLVWAIYQWFVTVPPTISFVDMLGRALLAAVFRMFLWGPELWQFVVMGSQPFLDWLLSGYRME